MSNASDFVIGKGWVTNEQGNNGYLEKYVGSGADVVIPECISIIGTQAFEGCDTVLCVTIPDNVVVIDSFAFGGCKNLKRVTIGNGVREINFGAFAGCSNLSDVVIGNSVIEIGNFAFQGCATITKLVIPESVEYIGVGAFENCAGLGEITLPKAIKIIEENAFNHCAFYDDAENWQDGVLYLGPALLKADPSIEGERTIRPDVICIAGSAFKGCEHLTGITVPQSLRTVGCRSFEGCVELTNLSLHEKVTEIRRGAFRDCKKLTAVTISGSVKSFYETFSGCIKLKSITIPDGVESIGSLTFKGCGKLNGIRLPESLKRIGDRAFEGCRSLTDLTIPPHVKEIGKSAFKNCTRLESVEMPDGLKEIDEKTFFGCKSLRSVTIPAHIRTVPREAFSGCASLQTIRFAFRETTVAPTAFSKESFPALARAVFPAQLSTASRKELAAYAAEAIVSGEALPQEYKGLWTKAIRNLRSSLEEAAKDNRALRALMLGEKMVSKTVSQEMLESSADNSEKVELVEYIHRLNNEKGNVLEEFDLDSDRVPTLAEVRKKFSVNIIDGKGVITAYKSNDPKVVIPKMAGKTPITEIGDNAFEDRGAHQRITSVILPNGITRIGNNAFRYCKNLESITFPETVTHIGDEAFWGCDHLKCVTIPESVIFLGKKAFDSTAWFEQHPDGLVYLGKFLYRYKGDMPENSFITLNDGTKGIAGSAFFRCENLNGISVPDSVTYVGDSAFSRCENLKEITLPNRVKSIGEGAFSFCWNLTEITIPDSVAAIGSGAFKGCHDTIFHISDAAANRPENFVITKRACVLNEYHGIGGNVIIPDHVRTVGQEAFRHCQCLTSVTIPDGATGIERLAFAYCENLTRATIPGSVTSIGESAFYLCSKLTIHAPAGSYAEQYAKEHGISFAAE